MLAKSSKLTLHKPSKTVAANHFWGKYIAQRVPVDMIQNDNFPSVGAEKTLQTRVKSDMIWTHTTLLKTNIAPGRKTPKPKRKLIFQPHQFSGANCWLLGSVFWVDCCWSHPKLTQDAILFGQVTLQQLCGEVGWADRDPRNEDLYEITPGGRNVEN